MPRAWTRGRTIVDGKIQFYSPSQIVKADPQSYGGCLRRWHYEKVLGKKEPETFAQATGTACHAEIETYLKTGRMVLSSTVLAGKRFLPTPGPDLLVEQSIDDGTLTINGLPAVGFMDVFSTRPAVNSEGDLCDDPPGTVEVLDWKFTGRIDLAKSSLEVGQQIPMLIYGAWAIRRFKASGARLSHVSFSTKKREAIKRTAFVPVETLTARWNRIEAVARSMADVASESDPDRVEANTGACDAYRTGCPHRAYCSAGGSKTLTDLFGARGAAQLLGQEQPMSLLKMPGIAALAGGQPAAAPPSLADQIQAAKAGLVAAQTKAAPPPPAPPPPAPVVDPAITQAIADIHAAGYGTPTLGGEAAKVWAAAVDFDLKGEGLAGMGPLGEHVTLTTTAEILQLAADLKAQAAQAAAPAPAEAPALLPPDAPASDPAKAAAPPEPAPEPEENTGITHTVLGGLPERPDKLSKKAAAYVEALEARVIALELGGGAPVATAVAGVTVYVDAMPTAGASDLAPWVFGLAKQLADREGANDIRCAPDKSGLAFGKWKGHLHALVREAALEPGVYVLDTRGSEVAEVAAEALRLRDGVAYVRGIR